MASAVDDVTMANLDGEKSKGTKDKHVQTETSGCGMIFKFMGKCVPLKSGNSKQDAEGKSNTSSGQPVTAVASSSTNSNAVTAASTSNKNDELKIASELRKFSFHELKMATRNFRPEYILGEGGFGRVFKGWISEKGTGRPKPVAVKTLDHEGFQGHKEWLAEITYLGELHHPNLVKLIGYCIEDEQRLLVYEFMARGSLENHLLRRNHTLIWSVRLKIMLGAAKGLAFLHEEAARPVIFRDFKTSNVLLDEDYNAKLSDFGLAKDGPVGDSTHVSTRILGTQGYAAPEYFMTGHLSTKSDVYSFGIVLLEMLTGRKAIDQSRPNGERNLVEWCRPRIGEGKNPFQLIDHRLHGIFSLKGARKALVLATHCLQRDPKARPQMSEVVSKLTPLLYLNDLASTSSAYRAMESSTNVQRTPSWSSRTPSRTPPRSPNGRQASPFRANPSPFQSPRPYDGNRRLLS